MTLQYSISSFFWQTYHRLVNYITSNKNTLSLRVCGNSVFYPLPVPRHWNNKWPELLLIGKKTFDNINQSIHTSDVNTGKLRLSATKAAKQAVNQSINQAVSGKRLNDHGQRLTQRTQNPSSWRPLNRKNRRVSHRLMDHLEESEYFFLMKFSQIFKRRTPKTQQLPESPWQASIPPSL